MYSVFCDVYNSYGVFSKKQSVALCRLPLGRLCGIVANSQPLEDNHPGIWDHHPGYKRVDGFHTQPAEADPVGPDGGGVCHQERNCYHGGSPGDK